MTRSFGRVAAALAAMCFLVGCHNSESPSLVDAEPESRIVTLCLEPDTGDAAAGAANVIAEMAQIISDGAIVVEVINDELALDAMLSRKYDLYLVSNSTASRGLGDYAAFSSPYYFDDYHHMSMSLNSERLGELLNARTSSALNVTPMTAFYGGSRVIIHGSSAPVAPVATLEDLISDEPEVLRTKDGILERMLGARASDILDKEQIIYNFERRRTLLFDFYKGDMGQLVYHERLSTAYLIDDFHIVDINWLMLGTEAANGMSDWELAVLKEAAAYAWAQSDASMLAREDDELGHFRQRFGETSVLKRAEIASQVREAIRESGRYESIWSWDIYDEVRAMSG